LGEFGYHRVCQVAATMSLIQRDIGYVSSLIARCSGKFVSDMNRKAVGQSKHDVLNQIGRVEVREVAARAPTGMAIGRPRR
jgi:hypothetical protein